VLALGALVAWTAVLSRFAGESQVKQAAAVELFTRLVPYRPGDFLSILTFIPVLLVIALPAAAFVVDEMRVRWPGGTQEAKTWRGRLQTWWRTSAGTPFERFLLCWLAGNVIFLGIAPAKSPRYSLPIFAPFFLLAASYIYARAARCPARPGTPLLGKIWRGLFVVMIVAAVAALGLAAGAALFAERLPEVMRGAGVAPFLPGGVLWMAAGLNGLRFARRGQEKGVVIAIVLIALGAQGPVWGVWWPLREANDSRNAEVAAIEAHLAEGEPVLVLGRKDFNAIAYYSPRDFYFLNAPAEATEHWQGPRVHFLLLERERAELLPGGGDAYETVARFEKEGKPAILVAGPMPERTAN
jgi:4-amino-4-deoxy-L-arabinose transferase-like glycosyltransferase